MQWRSLRITEAVKAISGPRLSIVGEMLAARPQGPAPDGAGPC
jgi:hypothetical protein